MFARETVYERCAPNPALIADSLRETRHASFWLDDVGEVARSGSLVGNRSADLTIVGGGYTGLWTAVRAKLRNPDAHVVLLEAHEIGWAASGRNGGFCAASLTHGDANGRARWPEEFELLESLGRQNLDGIETDIAQLGLNCEFERTGTIDVAVEEHEVSWLREGSYEYLDAQAVRAQINSPIFLAGGLERDNCALVHPARMAHELARAARELGVQIHENSNVMGLDRPKHGGPVRVRTERGIVSSDTVALATNVFPSLLKRSRLMTVPVYDYVLMTEPLTDQQHQSIGWRGRQGLGDLANQFHYSRLTADNRILFGGYDAIYHYGRRVRAAYEDRPASYSRLASHFFTMFPQLEGVKFSHKWAGAIDTSTQFCAFHGLAANGRIAYAAGFTGLGVGAARFAADVMLDRLEGLTTPRTQLSMVRRKPLPFPPEPIAFLGIQCTRQSLDRADHRGGRRNLFLRAMDRFGLGFDS
jgi:glycine/D-amino acid oxidase-like deaminating enzyme